MGRFGVGQAIRRVEDERFLTGNGRYTDDIAVEGQTYLFVLRSPHAHAAITSLEVADARAAAGVIGVLTAADLEAMNVGAIPVGAVPRGADGKTAKPPLRPVLATDRVRYVGEPVAAVIAETLAQARDAADLIQVEYEDLPAVVSLADAPNAPAIHAEAPGNVLLHWHAGDTAKTEDAFAKADHIVAIDLRNSRILPTALEPRGAIAEYDAKTRRFTLTQGSQGVHSLKNWCSQVFGVPADDFRVVTPDVGGGFGMKNFLFNEPLLCLAAARAFGRVVRWMGDRAESCLNDCHGRDQVTHGELALDKDGTFLGLRVAYLGNVGAYLSQYGAYVQTAAGGAMYCGAYRIPAATVDAKVVMTNTAPLDAYRGAGRPEAAYLIERLVEKAALELGVSSIQLRRRNLVRADEFPYQTALGPKYDSGRYGELLDAALLRANVSGLAARKAAAKNAGKLRGLGISYYVEACAGGNGETPQLFFGEDARLSILIGTQSNGQGHETVYAQIAADAFGIPIGNITVKQGDSDLIPTGFGTGGSRSVPVGGSAVMVNCVKMIDQGKAMAAALLGAQEQDVTFDGGAFRVAGTNHTTSLKEVIAASFDAQRRPPGVAAGLKASENFSPSGATFPNGCHICELDVDEDTGVISFVNYTIQDDLGRALNPLLMEGQIVGGAVQGLGQALYEEAVYDETGQLLTGSFMDYCMPRADSTPAFSFAYTEVPTDRNALGLKGAGEAGTIGATPAVVNAVLDALAPLGVTHLDMPLTPLKVWEAITAAKAP
ncbi:MAG: xanthine dehydrogenase family protein molybdopterin-binding subunit [Rhodospirillaceae bacterium]